MVDGTANPPAPQHHGETRGWTIFLLVALALFVIAGIIIDRFTHGDGSASTLFTQWKVLLGVIATLGIFTVLYQENPFFRLLEHIFIGLAAGYGIAMTWVQIIWPRWVIGMVPATIVKAPQVPGGEPIVQGQWWLFLALPIGLLFYTVYFPRLAWMNRLLISVLMGYYAGYVLQGFIGLMGPQIVTSFKPPVTFYRPENMPLGPNNFHFGNSSVYWHPFSLIFIVAMLCAMTYLFFSIEHDKSWVRRPANAGRYFLMITLGAIFGTTVMGRFSLLIVRLEFLLNSFINWFGMLHHHLMR